MKVHRPARRNNPNRTLGFDTAAWKRLRQVILNRDPLCVMCLQRDEITASQHVDHKDNDPSNNELDNLQGLCGPCHSRKTAKDMGKRVAFGCDEHGNPLDPEHHWNKEKKSQNSFS